MCQKIHKPVETQSSMRKLRRQFGPCMAASCHLRAIEGDGTGHLALPEGPCREPWEASISLAACGTYPLSTPARRSGPMPKIEHCTVLMSSDYRCWHKAQPRPSSCTRSPKAHKTYINPEFESLAFCPITCIPAIVPLPKASCNDTSDALCISLARTSARLSLSSLLSHQKCRQPVCSTNPWHQYGQNGCRYPLLQVFLHASKHPKGCIYPPELFPKILLVSQPGVPRNKQGPETQCSREIPPSLCRDSLHWIGPLQPKALPLFPKIKSNPASSENHRMCNPQRKKFTDTASFEEASALFLTKLPSASPVSVQKRSHTAIRPVQHIQKTTRAWYTNPQPPTHATRAATFPRSLPWFVARHYTSHRTDANPEQLCWLQRVSLSSHHFCQVRIWYFFVTHSPWLHFIPLHMAQKFLLAFGRKGLDIPYPEFVILIFSFEH